MTNDLYKNLPESIRPGASFEIGSYTFEQEETVRFAKSWDPQKFHIDPEKAKHSLLGGLCASGWHTVSVWMKLQRKAVAKTAANLEQQGQAPLQFGPSPGMRHIRWIKPVYVGDTITYENSIKDIRASNSKPEWNIMESFVSARNQDGETVMTFESAVFLKFDAEVAK